MSDNRDEYTKAIDFLKETITKISPSEDPAAWSLHNAVWHLAKGVQQDMRELKDRLDGANNELEPIKRRLPR